MQKPLREEINDVMVKYLKHKLQAGEPVNVAALAYEMALSIIDMIMEQQEQNQAPLLATTIVTLGDEYLQRRGLIQTERRDN
jgi:DNA-binding protein Fis